MSDETSISFSLKDVTAPAVKLIEAVQIAVGTYYEPTHIRRMAQAKVNAEMIQLQGDFARRDAIEQRAIERVISREVSRQQNLEQIIDGTFPELPKLVSEKKVDVDWAVQFFENCQDVSDKEMQSLWSKILAGEVATPGTFSLRTINAVKLMGKQEAHLFTKFCRGIWYDGKDKPLGYLRTLSEEQLFSNEFISRPFTHLENIGLIGETLHAYTYYEEPIAIKHFGINYLFRIKRDQHEAQGTTKQYLNFTQLTEVGEQLCTASGAKLDVEYFDALVKYFDSVGVNIHEASSEVAASTNIVLNVQPPLLG